MCLKDATDVEFLCSSLRLFQSLIVEGRKELKYWFVRALIVEILFAFLRLYRDVSLTVICCLVCFPLAVFFLSLFIVHYFVYLLILQFS